MWWSKSFQWRRQLIEKWLEPITLDKNDLEIAWKYADELLKQIHEKPSHWAKDALQNKRQGYIGEVAFDKLCWEAGLNTFWANPESKIGDELIRKPWDFHIAKNQIENGDIEVKTTLWIKAEAWAYCEAHYVVFFELLDREIVNVDLQAILSENKSTSVQLIGYLKHEDVDSIFLCPGPYAWTYSFSRSELTWPEEILELLIKEENADEGIRRIRQK